MYGVVGMHHYWHYQLMMVALHLTAVVLLRLVMRRAGVGPWTATITASLLLLFGAGQDDIVNAFQIGFVGSFVFGLSQLVLADHDGPWDRRDWLGLVAGAAGLMCSGLGVTMVVVVGASVWMRRGLRAALGHVAPLATLYLVWWLAEGRPTGDTGAAAPFTHVAVKVLGWDVSGVARRLRGARALHRRRDRVGGRAGGRARDRVRPRRVEPLEGCGGTGARAFWAGRSVFLTVSGWGRWNFGADYSRQSRYLYLFVAFMLPALGVAVQAIGRRWPVALPAAVGPPAGRGPRQRQRVRERSVQRPRVHVGPPAGPGAARLPAGSTHPARGGAGAEARRRIDDRLAAAGEGGRQVEHARNLRRGCGARSRWSSASRRTDRRRPYCATARPASSVRLHPTRGSFVRVGYGPDVMIRNRDDATRTGRRRSSTTRGPWPDRSSRPGSTVSISSSDRASGGGP